MVRNLGVYKLKFSVFAKNDAIPWMFPLGSVGGCQKSDFLVILARIVNFRLAGNRRLLELPEKYSILCKNPKNRLFWLKTGFLAKIDIFDTFDKT